jgi:DNA-binding NarL/FixJ family response regulator
MESVQNPGHPVGADTVHLLTVDAKPDLLSSIPAALRQRPMTVSHAHGVEATLHRLRNDKVDLVIADIDTPDPSDVELLRRIRLESPSTKVFVISTGRDQRTIAALLRQRAYLVMIRPVVPVRLLDAIEHSIGVTNWEDDVELLSGTSEWFQIRIACKLQAAERAAEIFREVPPDLQDAGLDEFATAFRELLMNAIEHGARSDPQMSIYVNFVRTAVASVLYIRDPGPGFSMGQLDHAAVSNPDGTLTHATVREQLGIRPGGFGILMAQNMVDELIYSERGNEVILIKHNRPPET